MAPFNVFPDRTLRVEVTVYHYTTGSGFNRIVARFDAGTGDFPEAHDFADELWDRCGAFISPHVAPVLHFLGLDFIARLVEDVQGLEANGEDIPDDAFVATLA